MVGHKNLYKISNLSSYYWNLRTSTFGAYREFITTYEDRKLNLMGTNGLTEKIVKAKLSGDNFLNLLNKKHGR